MGFGILFVGYLLAFGFTSGTNYILSIIGIVGTVFLYIASKKLGIYSRKFKICTNIAPVLSAVYILNAILQLLDVFSLFAASEIIQKLVYCLVIAVVFAYNLYMYLGIADIAVIAENKSIRVNAMRNLLLMVVYYVSIPLSRFILTVFPKAAQISFALTSLLSVLWLVLSIVLLLSAYMRISTGDDETTPGLMLK